MDLIDGTRDEALVAVTGVERAMVEDVGTDEEADGLADDDI